MSWDQGALPAYLCRLALLAYSRPCCIRHSLGAEGLADVVSFGFAETIRSKLLLLGSILLVLATAIGPAVIAAEWYGVPIIATFASWPYIGWMATALVVAVGSLVAFFPSKQEAFGFVRDGRAFLAFKGTADAPQLLLTDGAALPWGRPARHFGFERAWHVLRPEVLTWLEREKPASVVFTGHSLGGAMATLAAHELSGRLPVEAVVTFGSPRPGLHGFHDDYEDKPRGPGLRETLGAVSSRFVHDTDLVPRVPPPLIYWHVGEASYIARDGTIGREQPPRVAMRAIRLVRRAIRSGSQWLSFSPGYDAGLSEPRRRAKWDDPLSTTEMSSAEVAALRVAMILLTGPFAALTASCWVLVLVMAAYQAIRDGVEHQCEKKYLRSLEGDRPVPRGSNCGCHGRSKPGKA